MARNAAGFSATAHPRASPCYPRAVVKALEPNARPGVTHSRSPGYAWVLVVGAVGVSCRHAPKENVNPSPNGVGSVAQAAPSSTASTLDAAAGTSAPAGSAGAASDTCNEQSAQELLVGAHANGRSLATPEAMREWRDSVARSIRYRTEQYGYFKGFGEWSWNKKPLDMQIVPTKFFGVTVRLHERVIPALTCVEEALLRECAAFPYRPSVLGGIRDHNTYVGGDVSNHVYGIAIDVDPMKNPCCGCIKPWNDSPLCKGKKSEFERMAMPECWVHVFERYGFYWLGHDALKDTMHFEFLGDPAKIAKAQ